MSDVQVVFRYGSATDDALTPREQDLTASEGGKPGLSVELDPPRARTKAQKIDVHLLREFGLAYFADDPTKGGRGGHGVIAPVDHSGDVDYLELTKWASFRGTGRRHPLTDAILKAIVQRDVRGER